MGSNPTRSIFINLVKYGIMLNLILVSRTEYIAIYRNAGIVITSTITIGFVDIATTTMELLLKLIACEERGFRN